MGVTEGDVQVGIDVDVILENCKIFFVINIYIYYLVYILFELSLASI